MSGGAITGIVIGSMAAAILIAIIVIALLVFMIRRHNRRGSMEITYQTNGNIQYYACVYICMYVHTCNAKGELSHLYGGEIFSLGGGCGHQSHIKARCLCGWDAYICYLWSQSCSKAIFDCIPLTKNLKLLKLIVYRNGMAWGLVLLCSIHLKILDGDNPCVRCRC